MPDLLDDLKLLDPVAEPLSVRPESLEQLRTGVLASPRPLHRRWIAPVAAAAAVVIAVSVIWSGMPGNGKGTGIPADSPSAQVPVNTWVPTSASPLSPRNSSVAIWADHSFYVIGGTNAPVCPATADCTAPTYLRDGARYDPATDTWTKIATAPDDVRDFPVSPRQRAVVIGRTIYLIAAESLLAYDLDADSWQTLPLPPRDIMTLGATSSGLVAVLADGGPDERISYAIFRPNQHNWVVHLLKGKLRGVAPSAAVLDDKIVVSTMTTTGSLWAVDTIDLVTAKVEHLDAPLLESFYLDPIPLTTSRSEYTVWRGREKRAVFLDSSVGTWSSVDLPKGLGTFAGAAGGPEVFWPITTAGMVPLRGYLYDPERKLWSDTPPMPTAADSPVIAGGPESVLSCFGYDFTTKKFGTQCYVLHPAAASLATP